MDKCQHALAPFAAGGDIGVAGLWVLVGAAQALSHAAAAGELEGQAAKRELQAAIVAMVERQR